MKADEIKNKLLSIDVIAEKFNTLTLTHTTFNHHPNNTVELFYEGCLAPIVLEAEEYNNLLDGHIVELHKGEVAIKFL